MLRNYTRSEYLSRIYRYIFKCSSAHMMYCYWSWSYRVLVTYVYGDVMKFYWLLEVHVQGLRPLWWTISGFKCYFFLFWRWHHLVPILVVGVERCWTWFSCIFWGRWAGMLNMMQEVMLKIYWNFKTSKMKPIFRYIYLIEKVRNIHLRSR